MSRQWTSVTYAFFDPIPNIEHIDGRRCHIFKCAAKSCKYTCCRFLYGKDAQSTGNMRRHAKSCWGEAAVSAADNAKDVSEAHEKIMKGIQLDGSITALFERKDKDKVTFSHRQHTRTQTKYVGKLLPFMLLIFYRAEIVRWVSESLRPFSVVEDRGFQSLMKTGCPGYFLPSSSTVSRDVKLVFARSRKRIAKMLQVTRLSSQFSNLLTSFIQEYDGKLNFATDAWTSPNHRAFVAVTVHRASFPCLSQMALDYLTIPGTNLFIVSFVLLRFLYSVSSHIG